MKKCILLATVWLGACATTPQPTQENPMSSLTPPVAERIDTELVHHGDVRLDPYYWMRDRENPAVISYLEAENAYTKERMAHTEALQASLFEEMVSRIKEDDETAPTLDGGYYYYSRTIKGENYEVHCRKKGSLSAPEEVLLDGNEMGRGKEYFAIGEMDMSPDHRWMAYSTDYLGNERYTLRFRNVETGEELAATVPDTYYSLAWASDNKTLFYTRVDEANRPYQVWRHVVGTDAAQDVLVYQEDDDAYFLGVSRSRSGQYIFITMQSKVTTEYRLLDASKPDAEPVVFAPRRQAIEYYIDHVGDSFYIVTNDNAVNFRLMKTPQAKTDVANWKEVIAHDPAVTLTGVDAFEDFIVVQERRSGVVMLRVRDLKTGKDRYVPFPESSYTAGLSSNPTFDTKVVRFRYASLTTPRSVYDYDTQTGETILIKETEVPNYDRTRFESQRIFATAPDGVQIPISIVYKKGALDNGPAPMFLTGYGSYGISYEPSFSSSRIALLERGIVFGIAHIRGGGDLGRTWYEDGKFNRKMNTFTDFIAASEHIIKEGLTSSSKLAIEGGSAGGLLMGAVINMRPDLYAAVIAAVPFVDVLTTILDPSLPLTVIEWEEWGNPAEKTYYDYIKSYSPYDNVEAKAYPDLLVTAGLNDPRVSYWEPAKWVAKMRHVKTGDNLLLLKTNMGAGHGGASGRYDYLKELAFEYAFVIDQVATP